MHTDFHGEEVNFTIGSIFDDANDHAHFTTIILLCLFIKSNSCSRQFYRQLWQIQFLHGC